MAKRIVCLVFALMLALAALVSCGGDSPAQTTPSVVTTEPTAETTEPVTTEPAEELVVPENYFLDGYEYTILCTALMTNPPTPFAFNDTGLVLDEAVYRRNTLVEDTYGIATTSFINSVETFK